MSIAIEPSTSSGNGTGNGNQFGRGGEVRTSCPYCGVGCGVAATPGESRQLIVRGDPRHPANTGKLCSKGSALAATLNTSSRLLHPSINQQRCLWSEALDRIAAGMQDAMHKHGPESIAFYVSGQLLTEDYYVVNKLVKGYLGTANIDTNSRLCMASSVAGHKRAFGSDTVPGCYEDLERADVVIITGANMAWCHPVLFQRLSAARAARPDMRIALIDPRRSMTAELADIHLAIKPDGDAALFNGLLAHLYRHEHCNTRYIEQHVNGYEAAVNQALAMDDNTLMDQTGLNAEALTEFYELFAHTDAVVTVYSQGVNQSHRGTDTVNSILNCHLATGRIGHPGCGPFSLTGQPNAMGGREVGGLSNMLAAHMELDNAKHRQIVQRFWNSPRIADSPGPKAVELFDKVHSGEIKVLWIMGTNPVDSMPDASRVESAIARCPLVIVSDVATDTDTLRHAHIRLPAQAWGEKNGTVTNSERCISRQRALVSPLGEARPDWWAVAEVARRLGFEAAFDYPNPAAIFREHAALSACDNRGKRDFDIGAVQDLSDTDYDRLEPFQWPWRADQTPGPRRLFANGRFYTPDHKARMQTIATTAEDSASDDYPLLLNTGRLRDHWHTLTRTGYDSRLSAHIGEPFAQLHPVDAASHGIKDADVMIVSSALGHIGVRALINSDQQPGFVFVPMHWTDQFAARARVDRLIAARTDPISGQPALKSQPVRIARFPAESYAYVCFRPSTPSVPTLRALQNNDYWAVCPVDRGWQFEMASAHDPRTLFMSLCDSVDNMTTQSSEDRGDQSVAERAALDGDAGIKDDEGDDGDTVFASHLENTPQGIYRRAIFHNNTLVAAIYVDVQPVEVSRAWLKQQLASRHRPDSVPSHSTESLRWRTAILAGRAPDGEVDPGALVCSCFGIGRNQIAAVIAGDHSCSVELVGERLSAGTNCGSCRSEISRMIQASCRKSLQSK